MNRCTTCGQTLTMGDLDVVCGRCQARASGASDQPSLLLVIFRGFARLYHRLTRRERMPIDLVEASRKRRTENPE